MGPRLSLCSVAVLGLWAAGASAQESGCRIIDTVPFSIKASGVYCLGGDLEVAQDARAPYGIFVGVDDVTVDLGGHRLAGSKETGILGMQRRRVTVRNGTVAGFRTGIAFLRMRPRPEPEEIRIEHLKIIGSRNTGINVTGSNAVIRGNMVLETGGDRKPVGAWQKPGSAVAIRVEGQGLRVIDNRVKGLHPRDGAVAYGIYVYKTREGEVAGNTVEGQTGIRLVGIMVPRSAQMVVTGNNVTGATQEVVRYSYSNR